MCCQRPINFARSRKKTKSVLRKAISSAAGNRGLGSVGAVASPVGAVIGSGWAAARWVDSKLPPGNCKHLCNWPRTS